jgi:hypothetical protein
MIAVIFLDQFSVSQSVCRGLFFGVPPSFKIPSKAYKTVPFPTFWPYFTPKCAANFFKPN